MIRAAVAVGCVFVIAVTLACNCCDIQRVFV